jgi:L-ascorbate metabolism protein UlaG (beta-lactamase superfamily)
MDEPTPDPAPLTPALSTTSPLVTWVGHSTALIEVGELRILTDPVLTQRVAHLRRRVPPPAADVGDVDVVLISHVHMDHLHVPSMRRIRPDATVLTPTGSGVLARRAGFADVREVVAGDRIAHGPVVIEVVPAAHGSTRGPHSRIVASPVGYVVDAVDARIYFAGDTDLFDAMRDVSDIDLALLPIWGWGPWIGHGHLDPVRAAEAVDRIRPRRVVPIHWATLAPESGRRRVPPWFHAAGPAFTEALDAIGHGSCLDLLEPGASVRLAPR